MAEIVRSALVPCAPTPRARNDSYESEGKNYAHTTLPNGNMVRVPDLEKNYVHNDRPRLCRVCGEKHINSGPRDTLPDHDSCGSDLPSWHPKIPCDKDPWAPFRELYTKIRYTGKAYMGFETADVLPPIQGQNGHTAILDPTSFAAQKEALTLWIFKMLKLWGITDYDLATSLLRSWKPEEILAIAYNPDLIEPDDDGDGDEETEDDDSDHGFSLGTPAPLSRQLSRLSGDESESSSIPAGLIAERTAPTVKRRERIVSDLQFEVVGLGLENSSKLTCGHFGSVDSDNEYDVTNPQSCRPEVADDQSVKQAESVEPQSDLEEDNEETLEFPHTKVEKALESFDQWDFAIHGTADGPFLNTMHDAPMDSLDDLVESTEAPAEEEKLEAGDLVDLLEDMWKGHHLNGEDNFLSGLGARLEEVDLGNLKARMEETLEEDADQQHYSNGGPVGGSGEDQFPDGPVQQRSRSGTGASHASFIHGSQSMLSKRIFFSLREDSDDEIE